MTDIAASHRDRVRKKKKKRKKGKAKSDGGELVFVGIHCRRTDHDHLEREKGMRPLRPSYFLEAMDLFREQFGRDAVVFAFVSDDPDWGRRNLAPRVKQGDLHFAGDGVPDDADSVGHDLALLSLCNHTILSYGTFSFWGGFLAGGAAVVPYHFPEYRG